MKTRAWRGLTSQLVYTWSKQMDNFFGSNGESGTHALGGQWHPDWSYGPSDTNHTHRFVAAFTYQIPGTFSNRWLEEAFGGWQVNGIWTIHSGFPFQVSQGNTLNTFNSPARPDRLANGAVVDWNKQAPAPPLPELSRWAAERCRGMPAAGARKFPMKA